MVIGGGRRAHKGELKKVWRRSRLHMYLDSRGVSCMRITQGYSAPPHFTSQHSMLSINNVSILNTVATFLYTRIYALNAAQVKLNYRGV